MVRLDAICAWVRKDRCSLSDRGVHQRRERGQVVSDGEAVGQARLAGPPDVPRSR